MATSPDRNVISAQLTDFSTEEIVARTQGPHIAKNIPLFTFKWDYDAVTKIIAVKEKNIARDAMDRGIGQHFVEMAMSGEADFRQKAIGRSMD